MKILLVALPLRLRARISGRLKEAELETAANATEMKAALSKETRLVILEEDGDALATLKLARETYNGPILYCAKTPHKADYLRQLQLQKVSAVLQHPVDPDELVRCAAIELGIRVPGLDSAPGGGAQMAPHLAGIWRRHEAANLERAALIAEACDLGPAELSEEEQERVVRAAHQLAGTLGSFGLGMATLQAREAEELLKNAASLTADQVGRLAQLARALETQISDPSAKLPELGEEAPRGTLLIFSHDEHACDDLVEAARQEGWRPLLTGDPEGLRKLLGRERPTGLVLDADNLKDCLSVLQESPGCPVVALVPSPDLMELDGCRTLLKPAAPDLILRALQSPASAAESRRKLLAVDDDPMVLESLTALLAGLALEIHTLDHPLAFWDKLEEVDPDLLILDLDMPFLSGLELCRAVRSDPHFRRIPVLFMSAYNDAETLHRVFLSGGDDYLYKPVVGPELRMRVTNRLERIRAYETAVAPLKPGAVAPSERPDLAIVASDDFDLVSELFDLKQEGYTVEHCQQGFDELLHHLTDQVDKRPRALLLQDPDCLDVLQLLESVGVTAHTDVWIRGQLSDEEVASVFALRGCGYFPATVPPDQVKRRLLRMLRRT